MGVLVQPPRAVSAARQLATLPPVSRKRSGATLAVGKGVELAVATTSTDPDRLDERPHFSTACRAVGFQGNPVYGS